MTRRALSIVVIISVSCMLSTCAPPLASPAIVTEPRVLAIIANDPTVPPGSLVSLTPIVAGNSSEGTFHWRICVRPEAASTGLPLSSFGAFEPDRGCDTDGALELTGAQSGREVQFAIPSDLFSNEQVLRTAFGTGLRIETARSLAQRAGISVVASVEWTVDGTTVTAFKRVLVRNGERNRNPPAPIVRVKNRELQADPLRTDETCEFTDASGPLRVSQGERVLFEPDTDPSWFETFTFVDASDNLVTASEGAFFNWYATAGSWDFGRARAPDINPTWIAPKRTGDVTMWLVLRDGHGGASVCRWRARVE